jgi:hypothetical protein
MVYCILEGAQIWLVTSQKGWMGVVKASDNAVHELRMDICAHKVAHILSLQAINDWMDAVRSSKMTSSELGLAA